jgi:hypothetical protein
LLAGFPLVLVLDVLPIDAANSGVVLFGLALVAAYRSILCFLSKGKYLAIYSDAIALTAVLPTCAALLEYWRGPEQHEWGVTPKQQRRETFRPGRYALWTVQVALLLIIGAVVTTMACHAETIHRIASAAVGCYAVLVLVVLGLFLRDPPQRRSADRFACPPYPAQVATASEMVSGTVVEAAFDSIVVETSTSLPMGETVTVRPEGHAQLSTTVARILRPGTFALRIEPIASGPDNGYLPFLLSLNRNRPIERASTWRLLLGIPKQLFYLVTDGKVSALQQPTANGGITS